jgi:hypothetical protein
MVVGEAPGANEDATGIPFVGAAGKLLDLLLRLHRALPGGLGLHLQRDQVPSPREPEPPARGDRECAPYLLRQIDLVKPEVILAVGTFAGQLLTGEDAALGALRGRVYRYQGHPPRGDLSPGGPPPELRVDPGHLGRPAAPPRRDGRKDRRDGRGEGVDVNMDERAGPTRFDREPPTPWRPRWRSSAASSSIRSRCSGSRTWWTTACSTGRAPGPLPGNAAPPRAADRGRRGHAGRPPPLERGAGPGGGMEYLVELLDAVPTAANIQYHARIVRDKALLRRLIEASTRTIQDVYDPGERTVEEIVDEAEQRVFKVAESHDRGGFTWIKDLLWETFENIEKLQKSDGGLTGVPSGLQDPGPDDHRAPEGGPDHRGGPPLHGEDLLGAERGAERGHRAQGSRWPSSRWRCRRSSSCSGSSAPRRGWTSSGSGGDASRPPTTSGSPPPGGS